MKTKFKRMSKEERKIAIKTFSEKNPHVYKRYKKLSNVCIFGIIYSVLALFIDLYFNDKLFFDSFNANVLLDCGVLLFCIFFLIFSKNRLDDLINHMIVEDLRNKQIEKWKKEKEELDKPKKTKFTKKTTKKKSSTKKITTKKKIKNI